MSRIVRYERQGRAVALGLCLCILVANCLLLLAAPPAAGSEGSCEDGECGPNCCCLNKPGGGFCCQANCPLGDEDCDENVPECCCSSTCAGC
jgi:hypothetical protein